MAEDRELRVFISYRRGDAAASAGRLYDRLVLRLGDDHVFRDVDKIAAGDDFVRVLDERLASCDALLAVIGPRWLDASDARGRRLEQPDDFVRRELEAALARDVRVVPVLVEGATVPSARAVPPSLQALAVRNAATLDDASFEADFDRLVDDLLGRPRGFARLELTRLERLVRVARWSLLLVPLLAVACAVAVWTHVLDYLTIDTRVTRVLLRAADVVSPPPDAKVLIAAITGEAEKGLGPLGPTAEWRRAHASLVRLAAGKARALAFDLTFEKATDGDGDLADAAEEARRAGTRVVFGYRRTEGGEPLLAPKLRGAPGPSDHRFGSACVFARLGLFEAPLAVLRGALGEEIVTATTPSLALAATAPGPIDRVDLFRRRFDFPTARDRQSMHLRYSAVERIRSSGAGCRVYQPDDEVAMLYIRGVPSGDWTDEAHVVPYEALLDGRVSADRLREHVVLVGTMKPGADEHDVVRGIRRSRIHGVVLHADAVANILTRRVVTTPTVGTQAWITAAMVLAGAAASVVGATAPRRRRRAALAAGVAAYVLAAMGLAAAGRLLNVHYDVATFLAAYALLRRLQSRPVRVGAGEAVP
jgi:CHASE2 domain-containing sensor protein